MDKVLIIEDEIYIWDALDFVLKENQYEPYFAMTGAEALEIIAKTKFKAICVDLGLPDITGIDLIKKIRKNDKATPILVLTASQDIEDKRKAYELLVDEYLHKPYIEQDLLIRLKATINRRKSHINILEGKVYRNNDFYLNYSSHNVSINNKEVFLSALQFDILSLLAKNAGKCISSEYIINSVKEDKYKVSLQTLRNQIYKIRKEIEEDPDNPKIIITKINAGYIFNFENE